MRRKLGKRVLDRVWPQSLGGEDIGALPRLLLEQPAGETFTRAPQRRRRRDILRVDFGAEGNSASASQGTIIVVGLQPAIGDHHRVGKDAPFFGERLGAVKSGAVNEALKQKTIVGWR